VSKFVGKFRKHKDYNDDYDFEAKKKRNRNEHSEIKKLKNYNYDEILEMYDDGYQKDSRKVARRHG
jgi:hypothetical protein